VPVALVLHRRRQRLALADEDRQLAAPRDARVGEAALGQRVLLRGQRDDDDRELGPPRPMDGRGRELGKLDALQGRLEAAPGKYRRAAALQPSDPETYLKGVGHSLVRFSPEHPTQCRRTVGHGS
jgi:Flp pilus assembly protein TadD